MSSSSALVIAMVLLMTEVNKLQDHPAYQRNIGNRLELAGYAATVENGQGFGELVGDRGVGTFGGSEDHTAILTASAGKLSQYSYCPVRSERSIALPDGFVFAIASSGRRGPRRQALRWKSTTGASQLAAAVAEVWRKRNWPRRFPYGCCARLGVGRRRSLSRHVAAERSPRIHVGRATCSI